MERKRSKFFSSMGYELLIFSQAAQIFVFRRWTIIQIYACMEMLEIGLYWTQIESDSWKAS